MSQVNNVDKAIKALRAGKEITGKDGDLLPVIKQLTEAAITAERDPHLAGSEEPNRDKGTGSTTVKTGTGRCERNAARERAGAFEPPLIKKNQTQLTPVVTVKTYPCVVME